MEAQLTPSVACTNCGKSGQGKYCSVCGRRLVTTTGSLRDLATEAWEEGLGIERRLLRTVWQLARRPGFVTSEYREGRGARYISPVRTLLFSSAVYLGVRAIGGEAKKLVFGDVAVGYEVLYFVAVPLFAWMLFASNRGEGRAYSEYLTFVVYFQAAVLLCTALVSPLPPVADTVALSSFAVYYLALGSRRLWGKEGVRGWMRAAGSLILYLLTLFLVLWLFGVLFGSPIP